MKTVKFLLEEGVELPQYATEGSVGFDLRWNKLLALYNGTRELPITVLSRSISNGYLMLRGFERALLGTGIRVDLPIGYEMQIRPRSGVSLKRGLLVNFGTIDHDYRGEIGIIVTNNTNFLNRIELNERLAQGVINRVFKEEFIFEVVSSLSETDRGEGGFGHTGNK